MVEGWNVEGVAVGKTRARFLYTTIPYHLFCVDGLLVDTGPLALRREIEPFLAGLPIELVVLTHLHEDHCGLASWLAGRGVPIFCPEVSLQEAAREPRLPLYRRLTWGRRPAFPASPLPETVHTEHHEFQVVRAPGHTPRHVLFYEAEHGWLFTGDFFLSARPKVVFMEEDLAATLDSLKRIETLGVRLLFDAHAGPLYGGARLLAQKRAFLEELGGRVAALRREGLDDRAIDRRLFPHRPAITFVSRGEWSSLRMVQTAPVPEGARRDPSRERPGEDSKAG